MSMQGKRVLVTGGSSGIGRETAILLGQLGANVILAGRDSTRLNETIALLQPGDHFAETVDLSESDAIVPWVEKLARSYGKLDGLVHSAGTQTTKPLRSMAVADAGNLLRVNSLSAFALAKAFQAKSVLGPQGGAIVFLASSMGLVGSAGQSMYSASKGAIIAMTKSLAMELVRDRIRVNCVAPAMVCTEMMGRMFGNMLPEQIAAIERTHPLGFGEPRDVANAIAFLLCDCSRWITGSTLVVDGGYTAQ